jgi:hypothetical protein
MKLLILWQPSMQGSTPLRPAIEHKGFVRFQVLTAASVKLTDFWVVTPCSLVEVYRRFSGACCLHHQANDGDGKHLRNVRKLLPDYTAKQPRRQMVYLTHQVSTFLRLLSRVSM